MWVALHLSACKLQTVFLFPAVMVVAGEALWELQTGKKRVGKVVKTKVYTPFIMESEMGWFKDFTCF